MSALRFLFLTTCIISVTVTVTGHNITAILSNFPEYSEFNHYLSDTKLFDEINSRGTITVLVLKNDVVSSLAGKHPLSVVKSVLSLHILLDYYDNKKLHAIPDGTTLSTTLYQTTGNSPGNIGFVNITDLKGGKVGFGSAVAGSKLDSTYTKSVKQIPYNISAPAPSADVNITGLLIKAGCKTFVKLITETGVLKVYQIAVTKGLTVFAPSDEAFKATGVPDLSKLSNAELVALLQYHALASYTPKGSLKTTKGSLSTLATNGAGKYDLTVETSGDDVTLDTGVGTSRVASTVIDTTPLCIFTVDSLLLPVELFGKAPSPAPSLSPDVSPPPTPEVLTLEVSPAPSPFLSPPAPPTEAPAGGPAPADGPTADSENSNANTNGVDGVKASLTVLVLVATSLAVMVSFVLC